MSTMLRLTFNGAPTTVEPSTTVGALIDGLLAERRGIAAAVNDEVVPRSEWDSTVFSDGDRVDVLTAVQGG